MIIGLEYDMESGDFHYRDYTISIYSGIGYEAYGEYTYTNHTISLNGVEVGSESSFNGAIEFIDSLLKEKL